MKNTKQPSVIKAVRDLRSVPPQVYARPSDGRKLAHLCRERRALVLQMATYADADGSGIFPSEYTLARDLGKSRRAVVYLMAHLIEMGFVENDGWQNFGEKHTRRRRLRIDRILAAATPEALRKIGAPTAQDSQGHCATLAEPLRKIGAPTAQDSYCAQPPALPIQPPTHTGGACVDSKPLAAKDAWEQAMRWVPPDMRASGWKRGEESRAADLIAQHGWEKFVAAVRLYWKEKGSAFFDKTEYKWSGFLIGAAGWVADVTPDMLRHQAQQRELKTNPDAKAAEAARLEAHVAKQKADQAARMEPPQDDYAVEQQRRAKVVHAAVLAVLAGQDVAPPDEMRDELGGYTTITFKGNEITVDEETGKLVARPVVPPAKKPRIWDTANAGA